MHTVTHIHTHPFDFPMQVFSLSANDSVMLSVASLATNLCSMSKSIASSGPILPAGGVVLYYGASHLSTNQGQNIGLHCGHVWTIWKSPLNKPGPKHWSACFWKITSQELNILGQGHLSTNHTHVLDTTFAKTNSKPGQSHGWGSDLGGQKVHNNTNQIHHMETMQH